jgi:hypothetical protein
MPENGPGTREPDTAADHLRTKSTRQPTAARVVSRPGVVAGTVLRAARLSAGLSEKLLSAAVGANEATIHAWEDGSDPLAFAVYPRIERLEAALRSAGSDPRFVADLDAAAWCDLVLLALSGNGDVSCLLADPIVGKDRFRELLAWPLVGIMPRRYAHMSAPVCCSTPER